MAVDLVKAKVVYTELLGKWESAEQSRNVGLGGLYRENNKAAHQTKLAFAKRFNDAVAANVPADCQKIFDELLKKFEGADHMRNFVSSRLYHEDEVATKQTVKAFRNRFAATMV